MGVYPSQGNGNIAAVALTSALGGQNAFGSAAGDASTFLLLKKVDIGDIPKAKQMTLFEAVELDFEKEPAVFHHLWDFQCDHYEDPDPGV